VIKQCILNARLSENHFCSNNWRKKGGFSLSHSQLLGALQVFLISQCTNSTEYAYTLKVDEKSDVYSFGVVLLELVSGRKPVGEFGDGVDIVQWVRKMTGSNKEGVLKVLDPRLPSAPLHEAMHVFYVAMLCVEEQSVERPTMREVVQILTELPKPDATKQGEANASEEEEQQQESPPADLLSI